MNIKRLILEKKGTLIDVREKYELINEGSISHAINIPLKQIKNQVNEIKKMKNPLIFFCKSGNRSNQAIEFLKKKGVENLYNAISFKIILDLLKKK